MSNLLDSPSFDEDIKSKKDDNELREFLTIQEETARFNAQVIIKVIKYIIRHDYFI